MKACLFASLSVVVGSLVVSTSLFAQPVFLAGHGSNYERVFEDSGRLVLNPVDSTVGLLVSTAQARTKKGPWELAVGGGISFKKQGESVHEAGASIRVENGTMKFGVDGADRELLDSAGSGRFVGSWSASMRFDLPGRVVELKPNSVYQVSFYMAGENGLLDPTMNIFPYLSLAFFDGDGKRVKSEEGGSRVDLLTALGTGQKSGYVSLNFLTGAKVAEGPMSLNISAIANVGTTALQRSDEFLAISDLSIIENPLVPVPEPSVVLLLAAGGLALAALHRRKR